MAQRKAVDKILLPPVDNDHVPQVLSRTVQEWPGWAYQEG